MVPNYREIIIFGDEERFTADALLNIKRTLNTMSAADKTAEPFDVIVRHYTDSGALAQGLMPDEKVDAIFNRTNTGFCPMESAVWDIDEPEKAPDAIKKKLAALRG